MKLIIYHEIVILSECFNINDLFMKYELYIYEIYIFVMKRRII